MKKIIIFLVLAITLASCASSNGLVGPGGSVGNSNSSWVKTYNRTANYKGLFGKGGAKQPKELASNASFK